MHCDIPKCLSSFQAAKVRKYIKWYTKPETFLTLFIVHSRKYSTLICIKLKKVQQQLAKSSKSRYT